MTEQTKFKMGNFEVSLRKDEDDESLIRRFIKKTKKEKILEEWFERSRYKKPSVKEKERKFKSRLEMKRNERKRLLEEKKEDK